MPVPPKQDALGRSSDLQPQRGDRQKPGVIIPGWEIARSASPIGAVGTDDAFAVTPLRLAENALILPGVYTPGY